MPLFATRRFADAISLIQQFGRSFWRSSSSCSAIIGANTGFLPDKLEEEQRNTILPLVRECATVIAANTSVMERLEKHLN